MKAITKTPVQITTKAITKTTVQTAMNHFFPKVIFSTLLALSATLSVQAEVTDTVEKSFDVAATSNFRLENINGGVEISSWQQNRIQVVAQIEADNQTDRDKIKIEMEQRGDTLSVKTHYKQQSSFNHRQSGKVSYEIKVPVGINLAEVSVINGQLVIENVQGEVNADVVNGSVIASGLSQNSEINTVNGSIKVTYQQFASTTDEIELASVNGSIKLYLPDHTDANLTIETMHGAIKTEFGLTAEKGLFSGKHLKGDIGNGGVEISLESVNGSIKVLRK